MQGLLALALDHATVADQDPLWDPELLAQDGDLVGHCQRVVGVAGKDPYRQWFSLRVGEQADDDLQFAALAFAVVAELGQCVVCALQVGAGDIVEKQRRRLGVALPITLVEGRFDARLAGTEIIQSGIEIVLVEAGKPEHFGHGVLARPAYGRESGALVGNAGQHEEQG